MQKLPKLNIIYEDNHLLVVEKPSNIPVQEDSSKDIDMLTLLKEYRKINENKPGEAFIGLVHRLDRRVSGVMVFGKTSKAASRLSECIRNRDFKKIYIAICSGLLFFLQLDVRHQHVVIVWQTWIVYTGLSVDRHLKSHQGRWSTPILLR